MKVILEVLLVLGGLIIIALPFIFRLLSKSGLNGYFLGNNYYFSLIFLEVCGVIIWFLLNVIRKIFKTLEDEGEPFVLHNALHLKRCAWMCLVLSFLFLIKTIFDFSLLSPVMMIVFFVGCLFLRVLADVFEKGTKVKAENDLTI
jgi:hypothetical protein